MTDTVLHLSHISKCYSRFANKRERLLNMVWPRHDQEKKWALDDISFEIKRGESVALIGRNGSGKSTLLQILTGTLLPTSGSFSVKGRVCALLELGSGFNPAYTGRENVLLNGLLLGLRKTDILGRFAEIEAFADIGAAIDLPVKTYSSGMVMRLAFAVQALCDPDILIIDEALSVGDFFFQQKCLKHIQALSERGVTLLFVSHDMGAVRDLCQKGIVLEHGRLTFFGKNSTAINHYLTPVNPLVAQPSQPVVIRNAGLKEPIWKNINPSSSSVVQVGIYNLNGEPENHFRIGERILFKVRFLSAHDQNIHIMLAVRNRHGHIITSQGTYTKGLPSPDPSENIQEVQFDITANLEAGQYSFTFTLSSNRQINTGTIIHETPPLGPLSVQWNYESDTPPFYGMFGLPMTINYTN